MSTSPPLWLGVNESDGPVVFYGGLEPVDTRLIQVGPPPLPVTKKVGRALVGRSLSITMQSFWKWCV